MKDLHLPDSGVQFNEEQHTYVLNGRVLSGVTGIVQRFICPDKYKDVPQFVLDRAAARGTDIHKQCELFVAGFAPSEMSAELAAFKATTEGKDWAAIEYIVSDGERYASAIDLVGDDCSLYDIKTTAKLDMEYISWQLSIYAVLFERQTGKRVPMLAAIYVRDGKCEIVKVERQADADVLSLLDAAANGTEWQKPTAKTDGEMFSEERLQDIRETQMCIARYEQDIEILKRHLSELVTPMVEKMQADGCKNYSGCGVKLSLRAASQREGIDTKRLKEELPDVWQKYAKISQVAAGYTIKVEE